ncbi:MAG: hypothetical protein ABIR47_00045 [Candidatus Kapaibacterium sp.]
MTKSLRATIISICVIALQGCYHTRLMTNAAPATDYHHTTSNSLFWGLVQDNVVPDNCPNGSMQEVRVTSNLGYSLITVVTLGIWSPIDVEWRCAKRDAPPDGPGQ